MASRWGEGGYMGGGIWGLRDLGGGLREVGGGGGGEEPGLGAWRTRIRGVEDWDWDWRTGIKSWRTGIGIGALGLGLEHWDWGWRTGIGIGALGLRVGGLGLRLED